MKIPIVSRPKFFLSLALLFSTTAAHTAPPEIRAVGNHLENKLTGEHVRLTGVNFPSLKWSTSLEGGTAAVSQALNVWKANVIRLAVNQNYWLNDTSSYRSTVASVVTLASNANAYVIIDLHYTTSIENMPDEASITFWQSVANTYKNNPTVLFNLYNEPSKTDDWNIWRNGGMMGTQYTPGHQALLTAIRGTGANNLVIAGGLRSSSNFTQLEAYLLTDTPTGNGVMYDAHIYPWHGWIINSATTWITLARNYPVILGECGHDGKDFGGDGSNFGGNSPNLYWDILKVADALKCNYTAWAYHPAGGPPLISDFTSYTPLSTSGAFVFNHLRSLRDPACASTLLNSGFESPTTTSYVYQPTGGSWTFTGNAGIQKTWLTAISGTQTAFLQTAAGGQSGQDGVMTQNVQFLKPGTYSMSFLLAQRGTNGVLPIVVSVDGVPISSGAYTPTSVMGLNGFAPIVTAPFTINSAGYHTIRLAAKPHPNQNLEALIDNVTITATSPAVIWDEGFQQAAVSNKAFVYRPSGVAWTYSGNSGKQRGAWSVPTAPVGSGPSSSSGNHSAFLQTAAATDTGYLLEDGRISQKIVIAAPGAYQINLHAAMRSGKVALPVQVLVDGNLVGVITPTSTAWAVYNTPAFSILYPGYHELRLVATPSPGLDKQALVDGISVTVPEAAFTRRAPVPVACAGFESPSPLWSKSLQQPSTTPWTFTGASFGSGYSVGMQSDGAWPSSYDGHHAPEGFQTAFFQSNATVSGSMSQAIHFPSGGTYVITFQAQRGRHGAIPVTVKVDGITVGVCNPDLRAFYPFTSGAFSVSAGNHTISFTGTTNTLTGNVFTLLDAVEIWPISVETTLNAEADSFVKGDTAANLNYGTLTELWVKEDAEAKYDRRSFLRFALPAGGTVSSARLRLTPLSVGSDVATSNYEIRLVAADNWLENTITWNNQPASSVLLGSIPGSAIQANTPVEIDLNIGGIQSYLADGKFSLALIPLTVGTNRQVIFGSRESTDSPALMIGTGN